MLKTHKLITHIHFKIMDIKIMIMEKIMEQEHGFYDIADEG